MSVERTEPGPDLLRGPASPGRWDPFLLATLVLALLLRGGFLLLYHDIEARGDESSHYIMGVLVGEIGHRAITSWAPGYELFQAGAYALLGPEPWAAKVLQVLLSTATVAWIYLLALHLGGRRPARIAAFLAALYPSFIAYSHYLFNETLYLFLLTGAIVLFYRDPDRPLSWGTAGAGVLFGLAALTRSVAVYFLPVWAGWCLLRSRPREAGKVLGMALVALLVVAPWTVRNFRLYDQFALVDHTAGLTAYFAFNQRPLYRDLGYRSRFSSNRPRCQAPVLRSQDPLPRLNELLGAFPPGAVRFLAGEERLRHQVWVVRQEAGANLAAMTRCEVRNGLAYFREHPAQVLGMLPERLYAFWGPNSYLLRAVDRGLYADGPLRKANYPWVKWAVVSSTMAVFLLAILALGRREMPRLGEWLVIFTVYYAGLHAWATAFTRYRLPLVPFAMALGAFWLARPEAPDGRLRKTVVGVLLAGYLGLCLHYLIVRLP